MNFDFSDYTYSGLIGIFSAIIGMCYPLMLQAIDRIDEKYHVSRFVELFKEEKCYCRFNKLLLLSIIFGVADPFALFLANNILWIQLLVLASHTLLVLLLLLNVVEMYRMILVYYNPKSFFNHLMKTPEDYLLELEDFAKYAAKNEDYSLYNSCMERIYELLSKNGLW